MLSDFSDSVPTMPPDNLQDFIVDPRDGVENLEQVPNIPGDRGLRNVANRNALAILFESILPWVNYGTGQDDEQNQHHLPEQANNEEED